MYGKFFAIFPVHPHEWRNEIPITYFITSSSKEVHLKPILETLTPKVACVNHEWKPFVVIVDNAQGEINVIQYAL
jgi:hypothetical protein